MNDMFSPSTLFPASSTDPQTSWKSKVKTRLDMEGPLRQ